MANTLIINEREHCLDVRRPGMVYAYTKLNPVFRGDAERWDEVKALAVSGVSHVMRIEGGVAVVANSM